MMAIRYTAKVFKIIKEVKSIIESSAMSDQEKDEATALLNMAEQLTQAGHLLACGRTIPALEAQTGLSEQQMRETQQFAQLSTLQAGETITISIPRDWFNFCRAIIKQSNPTARLRTRKTIDGLLMVTRIQ